MTIQAYQLIKGGSPARIALFRKMALDSANNRNESTRLKPHEWKNARRYTLKTYSAAYCQLSQGFNDKKPVWYSHTGPSFRNERYCDDVSPWIEHTGWFCDVYQDRKARGIVASLTHGRFIAGYELDDSRERVYFSEIYDDEIEAARGADYHAEKIADSESEYSEKYSTAQAMQSALDENLARLCEVMTLRNNPKFKHLRTAVSRLVTSIREKRETLNTDFAGVL